MRTVIPSLSTTKIRTKTTFRDLVTVVALHYTLSILLAIHGREIYEWKNGIVLLEKKLGELIVDAWRFHQARAQTVENTVGESNVTPKVSPALVSNCITLFSHNTVSHRGATQIWCVGQNLEGQHRRYKTFKIMQALHKVKKGWKYLNAEIPRTEVLLISSKRTVPNIRQPILHVIVSHFEDSASQAISS